MTYDLHLTFSDLVTGISTLVTIASIVWAVYERRKTQSAREEAARFRQLLIRQQVAEQFAQVPQLALDLSRSVRSKAWENAAESALKLSAELATLKGVSQNVVGAKHIKDLDTSLAVLSELNRRIPRGETQVENAVELMDACNIIVLSVHSIKRTVTIRAALGGDEDAK